MIYATTFNPDTLKVTTSSQDSGFKTLTDVVIACGKNHTINTHRLIVYPGDINTVFSKDLTFHCEKL